MSLKEQLLKNIETKHTPGPWTIVERHSGFICSVVHEAGPDFISVVDECTKANAQLIAAAPELLEAMQVVRAMFLAFGDCHPAFKQFLPTVESVIAKANGNQS